MLQKKHNKMMKTVTLFLFGLMILQAGNASAYDPEIGHKQIITTALKVYTQCFADQSSLRQANNQERVVQGDLSMDLGLEFDLKDRISLKGEGVFSKLIRPFNWHFYNPERADYSKVGTVEQSHINLWNDLIEGFGKNDKEYNKLLFVGGIIHLTEDLTVPAHVVPVYHGPTQIEYFGPTRLKPLVDYMQEKDSQYSKSIADKIDTLPPDVKRLENELLNNKNICDRVKIENSSLEDIRSSTVRFTLNQLQTEIPSCPGIKWQTFWLKPKGSEFFGRYNIEQNNPLFGEGGIISTEQATCKLYDMDNRYLDFVFALHSKAVESDMKVLYWGSNNMSSK